MANEQEVNAQVGTVEHNGSGGGGNETETLVSRLNDRNNSEVRYVVLSSLFAMHSLDEIAENEHVQIKDELQELVLMGDDAVLDKFRSRQGGTEEFDRLRVEAAKTLINLWPSEEPASLVAFLVDSFGEDQDRTRRGNGITAVKELVANGAQNSEDNSLQKIVDTLKATEKATDAVKAKLIRVVMQAERESIRLSAVLSIIC